MYLIHTIKRLLRKEREIINKGFEAMNPENQKWIPDYLKMNDDKHWPLYCINP